MVDAVAPIRRSRGRPKERLQTLHAREADDAKKCPTTLLRCGIEASRPRKGEDRR